MFRIFPVSQRTSKESAGSGEPLLYSVSSRYELDNSPVVNIQQLNLPSSALVKNFGGISISFHAANDNRWGGSGKHDYRTAGNGGPVPQVDFDFDNHGDNGNDGNGDDGTKEDDDQDDDTNKPNRAPRINGPVYLADVFGCAVALIGLSDLLRGTVDPDGDALSHSRTSAVSSGTLTQTARGWYFDAAMLGPVTVTYLISDGKLSMLQTAEFSVLRTRRLSVPRVTICSSDHQLRRRHRRARRQ